MALQERMDETKDKKGMYAKSISSLEAYITLYLLRFCPYMIDRKDQTTCGGGVRMERSDKSIKSLKISG